MGEFKVGDAADAADAADAELAKSAEAASADTMADNTAMSTIDRDRVVQ